MSYRGDSNYHDTPPDSCDPNFGDDSVWATDDDYSRVFDVYPEKTESHVKKRRGCPNPASPFHFSDNGEEIRRPSLLSGQEKLKTPDTFLELKNKATMSPYDSHFSVNQEHQNQINLINMTKKSKLEVSPVVLSEFGIKINNVSSIFLWIEPRKKKRYLQKRLILRIKIRRLYPGCEAEIDQKIP